MWKHQPSGFHVIQVLRVSPHHHCDIFALSNIYSTLVTGLELLLSEGYASVVQIKYKLLPKLVLRKIYAICLEHLPGFSTCDLLIDRSCMTSDADVVVRHEMVCGRRLSIK